MRVYGKKEKRKARPPISKAIKNKGIIF